MTKLEVLRFLETRRSVRPTMFDGKGPSSEELERILSVAMRVPDHKKLAPWRFIVFQGEVRAQMGEVMAKACQKEEGEVSQNRLETERTRFLRAPVVVGVISQTCERPGVPEWEQILSAGASAFNLCLAANALGFGTSWITEWVAYDRHVREALRLEDHERVAGFVYIGQCSSRQEDRERPLLRDKVTFWSGLENDQ